MSSEASELRKAWLDASQKYDYFIVTATGAVLAYLLTGGIDLAKARNVTLVESALVLLGASLLLGLGHLHFTVRVLNINAQRVDVLDEAARLLQRIDALPAALLSDEGHGLPRTDIETGKHTIRRQLADVEQASRRVERSLSVVGGIRDLLLVAGGVLLWWWKVAAS